MYDLAINASEKQEYWAWKRGSIDDQATASQTPTIPRPYRCQSCTRSFGSLHALNDHRRHTRRHRTSDRDLSGYFKYEQRYRVQKSIPSVFRHECTKCKKRFDSSSHLRNHQSTHETRDIGCWGCTKAFSRYSELLNHLESETCITTRVELDQLAAACEYYKSYVIPGCEAHLRTGDRRHHKATPVFKVHTQNYGCSKCDQHFELNAGLHSHLQSSCHHPLAYQCPCCALQYADISALLQHVETSDCTEGISYGTGSLGQLLHFLWVYLAR